MKYLSYYKRKSVNLPERNIIITTNVDFTFWRESSLRPCIFSLYEEDCCASSLCLLSTLLRMHVSHPAQLFQHVGLLEMLLNVSRVVLKACTRATLLLKFASFAAALRVTVLNC